MMRQRVLMVAACLAWSGGALAAPPPAGPAKITTAPVATNPATPAKAAPCTPAALLFGQAICVEQLGAAGSDLNHGMAAEAQKNNTSADVAARQSQQRQLQIKNVLWQVALIHKFGAAAITPGADEIESFRRIFDQAISGSYNADKATADYIQNLLDKYYYAPADEQRLTSVMKTAQLSGKIYEERQAHNKQVPPQYQFIVDNAERKIAANMLTGWKEDKALYESYGGDVIATRNGVQPIDAHRKFLAYIQQEGKFRAVDPAYTGALTDLAAYIGAVKAEGTLPPDMQTKYFSSPTWQFGLANNADHFAETKAKLDKIPTLGLKTQTASPQDMIGKISKPAPSSDLAN